MDRQTRNGWLRARHGRSAAADQIDSPRSIYDRRLRLESLEDRRLLTLFTVSNLNDAGDGSLRDAIGLANASPRADTIDFAAELSGGAISLTGGELAITEALTIDARPLAANVTIDANQFSRIFNITATTGDFTLGGLTLTGGRTTGDNVNFDTTFRGGAVRSLTTGNLTLDQSTVSGNSTRGSNADGGGISAGTVTLVQSTVSGNSTSGNHASGGGIYTKNVTLTDSTVSGNSTRGSNADGGGIWARYDVTLTQSTISGNSTAGDFAHGGGIFAFNFSLVTAMTLTRSTVTDNQATHATAKGGGVFQFDRPYTHPFSINGSIVAGNTAGVGGPDLVKDPESTLTVDYSLIGTGVTPTAGGNNVMTDNPELAPLANNGGSTQTHAPLVGSPAIDAGDPSVAFNLAEFDQRGAPFIRVFNGDGVGDARIDMGAFELITTAPATSDFNSDGNFDGTDFLVWQRGVGATGGAATRANGNADADDDVDARDLDVWKAQFGQSSAASAAANHPSLALPIEGRGPEKASRAARDAVFASGDFTRLFAPSESPWGRWRGRR